MENDLKQARPEWNVNWSRMFGVALIFIVIWICVAESTMTIRIEISFYFRSHLPIKCHRTQTLKFEAKAHQDDTSIM